MNKYPKATKFLQEKGYTLDQALEYFEKKEEGDKNVESNCRNSVSCEVQSKRDEPTWVED